MHARDRARAFAVGATLAALLLSGCARHTYSPLPLSTETRPAAIAAASLTSPAHAAVLTELGATLPETLWTPFELAAVAVARSPAVSEAQSMVAVARAATAVAGAPPPVGLEVEVTQSDALDPGESSRWTAGPRLSLRFSPMDKRRLRADVAGADVLTAEAAVLEAAWSARRRTVDAALELAAARRAREDAQARISLLDTVTRLARQQVDSGLTGATEWQLLQLDANNALLARAETVTNIAAAGGALAAALALPLSALDDIRVDVAAPLPTLPPRHEWQRAALTGHADILEALAIYGKRERELELAVAEQYPDIEISPGYLFDQGDNVWSLLGGLVLPLPALQHARISRALAARDAAGAAFERVQTDLIGQVEAAYAECAASLRAVTEFRAAHDAARRVLEEARALPLLEAADALVVPRAEVQLAVAAARLSRAAIDARRALAELEFYAARPVDDPLFTRQLAGIMAGAHDDEAQDNE